VSGVSLPLVAAVAVSFLVGASLLGRLGSAMRRRRQDESEAPPEPGRDTGDLEEYAREVREDARALRAELDEFPLPEYVEASERFADAAARLRATAAPLDVLVRLARDGDRWVSRIALAALAGRADLPPDWPSFVVRRLRQAPYDQARLYLKTLEQVPGPVIGHVLSRAEHVRLIDIAELIAARRESGHEVVDEKTFRKHVPLRCAEHVEEMLDEAEDLIPEVRAAYDAWRAGTIDLDFLNQFARVWTRPFDTPPALLPESRAELVELIQEAIAGDPPESLLLVGEHGVGKTTLARAALERLPGDWLVFEASAGAVNAGAVYVGELEGRVAQLVERLRGHRTVWVLPKLDEALYAGRHSQSPTGLLDLLLPHLQAGDLRIVAETSPSGAELVLAQRPQVASAFRIARVRPLGERDSIAVARHAIEAAPVPVGVPDQVLAESFELAQQFLLGAAPPGNLVRLLRSTVEAALEDERPEVDTGDVLATLASVSGLPLALLDPRAPLDLGRVRAYFAERVLGQDDAVEALVDRIALIKAGLTDPSRPLGVFLFVGPSGTGKTEIAKALAEFLFGSPSRMVRLDMSEYQTPDSLERLLSDTSLEPQGAPLVASVRRDPFSVVLLDEFEKAAAPVWDLFLQVFDDGRLTDRHGRTVDFRKCVIVLTANVGSSIARGPGLGFGRTVEPFRPEAVERALRSSFRPEFLNRIDRVVVFRPFEREQMRALLEKELAEAARRRGLRGRPWAVEYDESALSLLVERGFSSELGARPLKRAVERYLLRPLAEAIVEQTVPEGEQFLFVTAAGGEIEIRFVDPDAEDEDEQGPVADEPPATARALDLRSLTLAPRLDARTAAFLLEELRRLETEAEGELVRGRKEAALAAVSQPGFWEDERRFAVLAEAEYLDRFDAARRTAQRLAERLRSRRGRNGRGSSELAGILASRLHVLDRALAGLEQGAPYDVFLRIRPVAGSGAEGGEFAATLAGMYVAWAKRRGMKLERLRAGAEGEHVLAVGGLGAGTILAPEAGLHVLEVTGDADGERGERLAVAVEMAPRTPGGDAGGEAVAAAAGAAFASSPLPGHVVRRYRPGPSPLVRDAVRGYRTGRLDRVLAGDFDVY
jgi:ATP-dependent Clp protease ATP-binding subunit ClpC